MARAAENESEILFVTDELCKVARKIGRPTTFCDRLGPFGNRRDGPDRQPLGDAAGHSCMAVAGPQSQVFTLETGSADRQANMQAFAKTALNLLLENLFEMMRRPCERVRTQGPIPAGFGCQIKWFDKSLKTDGTAYGSLRSQGRQQLQPG